MKDFFRQLGAALLTLLLVAAAIIGGRAAFFWSQGDDTWHLLKLSHTEAPVYVEEGYQDDITCIFAGEHYLQAAGESINSYQCLRHCNRDHSICEDVIDGKTTASEQKAAEDYVKSLNLQ